MQTTTWGCAEDPHKPRRRFGRRPKEAAGHGAAVLRLGPFERAALMDPPLPVGLGRCALLNPTPAQSEAWSALANFVVEAEGASWQYERGRSEKSVRLYARVHFSRSASGLFTALERAQLPYEVNVVQADLHQLVTWLPAYPHRLERTCTEAGDPVLLPRVAWRFDCDPGLVRAWLSRIPEPSAAAAILDHLDHPAHGRDVQWPLGA